MLMGGDWVLRVKTHFPPMCFCTPSSLKGKKYINLFKLTQNVRAGLKLTLAEAQNECGFSPSLFLARKREKSLDLGLRLFLKVPFRLEERESKVERRNRNKQY